MKDYLLLRHNSQVQEKNLRESISNQHNVTQQVKDEVNQFLEEKEQTDQILAQENEQVIYQYIYIYIMSVSVCVCMIKSDKFTSNMSYLILCMCGMRYNV